MSRMSMRRHRRRLSQHMVPLDSMRHPRWMRLAGAGTGALLMYLLDPSAGSRRRALLRDQVVRSIHLSCEALGTTWRDARNRGLGLVAEVGKLFRNQPVTDDILIERVRAALGNLVRHPGSIEVSAENGLVSLRGPVLAAEVEDLLPGVRKVSGVEGVVNELDVHDTPGDIPGLQGGPSRAPRGSQFELMQENWSPTARMSVGLAGTLLAVYGALRRDGRGAALALIGGAAAARASLNLPLQRLTGVAAGHRAVDVRKSLHIAAPLSNVFAFWSRYADFPRYTTHVREVLEQGEGRSRWTVVGPAGITLSWNAVMTRFIPNEELAWRTEPDSSVQHAGILTFKDNGDGTTTLHAKITYNPPGGMVSHGVARLLRSDLKSILEEELLRIKTVLEVGIIPHDVQRRESHPMLKGEQLET